MRQKKPKLCCGYLTSCPDNAKAMDKDKRCLNCDNKRVENNRAMFTRGMSIMLKDVPK